MSLLELRGDSFVADRFDQVTVRDGFLVINALPPGDYDLLLKRQAAQIRLRVARGQRLDHYVVGPTRQLEVRNDRPLQIAAVDVGKDQLRITLRHATPFTRVHLLATRFEPAFSAFDRFATVRDAEPLMRWLPTLGRSTWRAATSAMNTAISSTGSMPRSSLAICSSGPACSSIHGRFARRTPAGRRRPRAPSSMPKPEPPAPASERAAAAARKRAIPTDFANLDFLAQAALVAANLQPEADGTVTIDRDALGPHQQLQIVAIDPLTTIYRTIALPDVHDAFRDTRLAAGLDPNAHFTQRKEISVVPAKGQFTHGRHRCARSSPPTTVLPTSTSSTSHCRRTPNWPSSSSSSTGPNSTTRRTGEILEVRLP